MTNEKAKKMLKAKLECLKSETSGINHDCNMRLCDGCSLNYEQGNIGEQKEALDMAIKALEQQSRDCKTCKHSENGNCAGTEECHECMWESKYEQQTCDVTDINVGDMISRQAVLDIINFEDKWLFDANGHNANTKIAFSGLESRVKDLPSVTPTSDAEDKYDIGYNCGYADAMCDIAGSEE